MRMRAEWFERVVNELQVGAGQLTFGNPDDAVNILTQVVTQSVPKPESALERVLLRDVLTMDLVCAGEKIEAITVELGYRDRTNFYRAFRQATSLTPTEFRALPRERADHMIAATRRRL